MAKRAHQISIEEEISVKKSTPSKCKATKKWQKLAEMSIKTEITNELNIIFIYTRSYFKVFVTVESLSNFN